MINVPVGGNGGSISIEVFGYENAGASDTSDANWLRSRVSVVAGPFSGRFDAALTTQDFARFARELANMLRTLQGTAAFQTDEEWLSFEVVMGPRGTCTVSGAAKTTAGSRASLRFAFESDQSWVAQTLRAVAEVVDSFPVRQSRS